MCIIYMRVYIYTLCMYVYMYTYINECVGAYKFALQNMYVFRMYVHMYVCMDFMYAHHECEAPPVYVSTYVCTHVCMYVCMYVHTHL